MAHLVLYHGLEGLDEGLDELGDVHANTADAALDYELSEPSNASEAAENASQGEGERGGTCNAAIAAQ